MSNKHIKKPVKFRKLAKTYSRKDTPHLEIHKHFENRSVSSLRTVDVESLPYVLDEDDDDSEITPVKQANRIKPKKAPISKPAHIMPAQNSLDSKSDLSTNVDLLDKKMQELNKQLFDIEKDIHTSFPTSSNALFGTKSQKSSLSEDISNKYPRSDFKKDYKKIDTRQIEQLTLPKIPDFKFHVTENDPSYNIRNEIMHYRQSIKDKQFEERIDKKLALLTGKCDQIQEKTYEDKQVGNEVEDGICHTEESSNTVKRTPEEMSINTQQRHSEESQVHVVSPAEERSDEHKSCTPRHPTIFSALQEVDLVQNFLTKTQKELSEIQLNFDDCLKSTSKLVSQSSHQLTTEVDNKTEPTKLIKTGKTKSMPKYKSTVTKPPLRNKESVSQINNKGIKKNIKRKTPVTEPINKKIDKVRVQNTINSAKYDCVFQQKDTRNRLEISVLKDDDDKIIESCPCRKECKSVENDPKPDIHLPVIKLDREIQVEETDFTDVLPEESAKPANLELVGSDHDSRNNENADENDPVCAKLNKLSIHNMPKIEIRGPLVLHKMPNIIIPPQKTDSNTQNFSNIHYLEIKHEHKETKKQNQIESKRASPDVSVEETPINNTPTNQIEILNTIKEMPDEDSEISELLNNQSESEERFSHDEESPKELNLRQELNLGNDSLPTMHSLRTIQNYLESKKTIIKENFLKYNVTNVKKMSVKTPLRSSRQRMKTNETIQTSQITDKTNSKMITRNECSGKSESSNAVSELRKDENISSSGSARPLCSKYDLEFQEESNLNLNKDTNNIKTDKSVCTYEFYSNKSVQCDFIDSKCKKLQISHVHFENIDSHQISENSEKYNSKTSSISKVPKNKHPPDNSNVPSYNSSSVHSQSTSTKRQNVNENKISKNFSPNSILKNTIDNNPVVKRKIKSNGIENNKNLINNTTQTDKHDIDSSQDKQISIGDKKNELNYADDDTLNSSFESIPVHGNTPQTSIKDDDNLSTSSKLLPKVDDQKNPRTNSQDNSKNNPLNKTFVLKPAMPSTSHDISKYSMNQYVTYNYSKDKFPVPVCSDLKGNVSVYRKRTTVTDSSLSTTYESSEMNLSDGEVDLQCKCSLSMGEIHSCHCAHKINQGCDKLKARQISSSDYSTQT